MNTPEATQQHGNSQTRGWLVCMAIVILVIASVAIAFYTMDAMKRRAQRITPGMPRHEVENIFGPPYLTLQRGKPASGKMLVWTDIYWQVDIAVDADDNVETVRCVFANSPFRRTQTKLESLLR